MSETADVASTVTESSTSDPASLKERARDAQSKGNGAMNGSANGKNESSENGDEKRDDPVVNGVDPKTSSQDDHSGTDSDVQMVSSDRSPRPSTSKTGDVEEIVESGEDVDDDVDSDEMDDDDDDEDEDVVEEIGDEDDDDGDVEEVKDSSSDSDIMEVEAEDPLAAGSNSKKTVVSAPSSSSSSAEAVITIDNMDTLRSLANDARKRQDEEAAAVKLVDTNSILSAKSGNGGVTITPTSSGISKQSFASCGLPSGLTISQTNSKPFGIGNSLLQQRSSPKPVATQLNDPNLTDDTYVVEAPSFIVPYVYEKPPKETIADFKSSIENIRSEKEKEAKGKSEESSSGERKRSEKEGDEESREKEEEEEEEEEEEGKKKNEVEETTTTPKPKALFFETVLGKFIMDLGMNLVQEQVKVDLLKEQQKRSHRDKSAAVMHAIMSLKKNIESSKETNKDFTFETKKCKFCSFKTESQCALENHMEIPHLTRMSLLRCNFCRFEHKVANEVLTHMFVEHGIRGRLERIMPMHQCPQCPYEDNMKGKLTRHKVGCDKRFRNERNQEPPHDWEPPAKIPKPAPPRGRMGMPNTATQFGSSAAAAAGFLNAKNHAGGAAAIYSHVQQFQQQHQRKQVFPNATVLPGMPQLQFGPRARGPARNVGFIGKGSPHQQIIAQQGMKQALGMNKGNNQVVLQAINHGKNSILPNLGTNSSVTIQSIGQRSNSKAAQPSISITPLPGRGGRPAQGQSPMAMKPGQPGGAAKGGFVICEICDGYIKDLEQLRNHMQWIHKVKIHPKMIYNRPPLNCQKCQFRFFTDQGLERHLLGSHGLVTASMQDLANRSQDSGRCPVCGKVYQWKLLNHVAKDHLKVLKPAHLSYKCTVCTATFGQYKLFENHVYTAHSGGNRKSINRQQQSSSSPAQGSSKAPIKVSDEITIIPQKVASANNSKTLSSGTRSVTLSKATPKAAASSDPDVIELDDDEEEIDEEMKESNESSANDANDAASVDKPKEKDAEVEKQKTANSSNGSTEKEPKGKKAGGADSGDEEGVEEVHDEEMDD